MTRASGTDWAVGLQARSRALLSEGEEAAHHYSESIARLVRTARVRTSPAPTCATGNGYAAIALTPRRANKSGPPSGLFEAMGMDAFAERARRELQASGVTVHKRPIATRDSELTAQEAQVARLARDGLTNPEIGTRLFISGHTVQYHLRKVFVKLGIDSRSQLDRVLPRDGDSVHGSREAAPVTRAC